MSPDHDSPDYDAERLLRAARPQPSEDFVKATERRLLGRAPSPRRRPRPLLAGLGLSGALASVVVVAGLVGAGPLAPEGTTTGKARSLCRTETVTTSRPVGTIVKRNGQVVVTKQRRPVKRLVTRCP
ncbi:MAG: hypothetical protein QOG68_1388 [Solirubrobacteraceae bacterium]|nr:hypothetical protein [Solirubrobacteraceae bacterium]